MRLFRSVPASVPDDTFQFYVDRVFTLPPQDRDDVKLLPAHAPTTSERLPADVPVRETKALVLGSLPLDRRTRAAVRPPLAAHLTTATDVLRLLATGRTPLWDLAVWHAAARTDEVAVVRRAASDDEPWHYARGEGGTDVPFAARVRALELPERRHPAEDPDGLAAGGPRRGMCCSPWCTGASPRRARADPCTGCRPARSTAAVRPP
ncbi:hypothetical protein [Streptomyces sp. NPDC091209]|uniref:hypothetical protein n=1 Tax=Streptomyces sp. NPDC091209 TaxID=3365974 RepID=UPI0038085D69